MNTGNRAENNPRVSASHTRPNINVTPYRWDLRDRNDLSEALRIQKTVFIKAPRALPYADVVHVLDSIKGAGASPIGLQIDDLN